MEETIKEVEKIVGPNSIYHLFLHQRMASIYMIQSKHKQVEKSFVQCVDIAVKGKYKNEAEKLKAIFLWQINLVRFYFQNDLEKAIDLLETIIEEQGMSLDNQSMSDVKFNLATAITLRGDEDDLKTVVRLFNEALDIC